MFGRRPPPPPTYVFGRADFPTGQGPLALGTGDFNGDVILDVGVVNSIDNTVSFLLGQRNGTLGPRTDFPVGTAPSVVVVGNFKAILGSLRTTTCGGGENSTRNPGTPSGTCSLAATGTLTSGSNALAHKFTLKLTLH